MSDDVIRWIPLDPTFVPSDEAIQTTVAWLQRRIGPSTLVFSGVVANTSKQVEFVDCGENFDAVCCNRCGAELSEDWWSGAMNTASKTRFENREVTLPCCGAVEDLHQLRYEWPMGFARFVLEARNPSMVPSQEDDAEISRLLGTPLRRIDAHY